MATTKQETTRKTLRLPARSRRSSALFASLWLSLGIVGAASNPPAASRIGNFHQVNEHIFRGAQPSPVGLQELAALGIKRVIDLREPGTPTKFEQEQLEKLGLKYINIPLRELSAPSNDQIAAVLKLLANAETPTFIHCRRGKDRTGTAIACYRVQHDGWDNVRALREAKAYGMSSLERGMQHYILHFTPTKTFEVFPTLPQ